MTARRFSRCAAHIVLAAASVIALDLHSPHSLRPVETLYYVCLNIVQAASHHRACDITEVVSHAETEDQS